MEWRAQNVGSGISPVPASAFVWGPEGLTEAEAGLLGPVEALAGRRVLAWTAPPRRLRCPSRKTWTASG